MVEPPTGVPAALTPAKAFATAVALGARRLVPIHYGFAGSGFYDAVRSDPFATEQHLDSTRYGTGIAPPYAVSRASRIRQAAYAR